MLITLSTHRSMIGLSLLVFTGIGCDRARQIPSTPAATMSRVPAAASPRPLYALAWSPTVAMDEIKPDLRNGVMDIPTGAERPDVSNLVPFFWLTTNTTPEQAKAALDAQPEGHRCMLWVWDGLGGDPLKHPDDELTAADGSKVRGIWAEHGIRQTSKAIHDFFIRFKAMGGQMDYLVMDYEYGFTRWHSGMTEAAFAAIENDPRFRAEGWPERLGCTHLAVELVQKPYPTAHQVRWNLLMKSHTVEILNRSLYLPLRSVFPNVKVSNYGSAYSVGIPDANGHIHQSERTSEILHVGTHQSAECYGRIRDGLQRKKLGGAAKFGASPFRALVLGVNSARSMALNADVPFMPWIAYRGFAREGCFYGNTDYFQELVLHVALTGPDVLLYWNPHRWRENQKPESWADRAQDEALSRLLKSADRWIGFSDRKTCVKALVPWDASYVLSGMTANGKTIWRLTPELDLASGNTKATVLNTAEPPSFRLGTTTVTFPGGRLLESDPAAPLGFWIESPEAPVIQ